MDEALVIQYNLTPRGQQVLALARMEAHRFNHNFVGTEHLLLGIIKLGQGEAVKVLQKLGLDFDTVRLEVEKQVGTGPDQKAMGNIPYTPRFKKVLSLANEQARALRHTYVGAEHLLLAIFLEVDGPAVKVLKSLAVDIERAREEILTALGAKQAEGASKEVTGVEPISKGRGVDEARVRQLGDRFVLDMIEVASTPTLTARRGSPFEIPSQQWTFLCLEILLAAGYTFNAVTLEVVLNLNSEADTLERLDIVCEIVRRCWSGDKIAQFIKQIQGSYNVTDPGSEYEGRFGRLLQRLTGLRPRKVGPEVDWLEGMDPACATTVHADGMVHLTTTVVPVEAPDASRVVTGGASITQPPPGGEH